MIPKRGTHRRTRSTMPDELNLMISGLGGQKNQNQMNNIKSDRIDDGLTHNQFPNNTQYVLTNNKMIFRTYLGHDQEVITNETFHNYNKTKDSKSFISTYSSDLFNHQIEPIISEEDAQYESDVPITQLVDINDINLSNQNLLSIKPHILIDQVDNTNQINQIISNRQKFEDEQNQQTLQSSIDFEIEENFQQNSKQMDFYKSSNSNNNTHQLQQNIQEKSQPKWHPKENNSYMIAIQQAKIYEQDMNKKFGAAQLVQKGINGDRNPHERGNRQQLKQ
ncbi:UNKNOWN [Stylonychia lemnae]|uniref:Uncharacterized protein n=1 Tax=Stylonychia lemnae TaxID=5949 RepID=A0A078AV55_STYLE|nr:UNKNOWN [Stylonychia lemnae]|eukprot:CDW86280.1 UNKNOWN [Stylonychia lemnae]